jgi:hypothetical protein
MKYVNKKLEYRGRCQIEGQVIEYERVIHYDAHGPEEENWMYRGVPASSFKPPTAASSSLATTAVEMTTCSCASMTT